MSGDALNPEPGTPANTPADWEEAWVNQETGRHRDARIKGLEILRLREAGKPLSPRESAYVDFLEQLPATKDLRQMSAELNLGEDGVTRVLADNIGEFLIAPNPYMAGLEQIIELSDERPPEVTQ